MKSHRNSQKISFIQKFLAFLSIKDSYSLFERSYYSNFLLPNGFPELLPLNGINLKRDIIYLNNPENPKYQSLDLYFPNLDNNKLPVLIFIHGGGWRAVDKYDAINVHRNFCISLAHKGFIVISVNHRLSPSIRHPLHIKDVANAIKWIYDNVGQYRGDKKKIFLSGHSSGGHIAALLLTDVKYLKEVELSPKIFSGFIGISGVYDILNFARNKFNFKYMIRPAFGTNVDIWKAASPISHVHNKLPPLFLINADKNDGGLESQSQEFIAKLGNNSEKSHLKRYPDTDHFLILSKIVEPEYSLTKDIYHFILSNS